MKFNSKEQAKKYFKDELGWTDAEISEELKKEKYAELPEKEKIKAVKFEDVKNVLEPELAQVKSDIADLRDKIDSNKGEITTEQFESLEEKVDGAVDTIKRMGDTWEFEGPVRIGKDRSDDDKYWGYHPELFSEFAVDVMKACKNKNTSFKHSEKFDNYLQKAQGLNEDDDSLGGFLIPEGWQNKLLKIGYERSVIMSRATPVPMSVNSVKMPYVSGFDHSSGTIHGGVKFYWVQQGTSGTKSNPKFGQLTLDLKELMALIPVTNQLLEDSPISMEPMLREMMGDGLAFTLDGAFLNGVGGGMPQGLLKSPALIAVAKRGGQGADTIIFENIVDMYSRLWRKDMGVWIANSDTLPQLMTMSMTVGTGGVPVWMPANGAADRPFQTLMGLPLFFSEHCPTLGDQGDIGLYDLSQYLVGTKRGKGSGLNVAVSMHLYFDSNEMCYRATFRVDGSGWWKSALTPRKSASTLSPFVTLAAR